ncbi:hypothetical protein [Embleya sp. NBC_00896]|uniref:hypothetical protein n=1 Tax=Embleya sp. NBC_00896 TaxID=2975961 RepID=UPI002F90EAF0|nr:hypothetical protein OG928_48185 [Embleya sp. NBC_00896]
MSTDTHDIDTTPIETATKEQLQAELAATRAAWQGARARWRITHTPGCHGATFFADGLCADCAALEAKGARPADPAVLTYCVYTDEGHANHIATLTSRHGPKDGIGAALLEDLGAGRRARMTPAEADAMIDALRFASASESIGDDYRPHVDCALANLLGVLGRDGDTA